MTRIILMAVMFLVQFAYADNCSQFTTQLGPIPYGASDVRGHLSGAHGWAMYIRGSCEYKGDAACSLISTASVNGLASSENGTHSIYSYHVIDTEAKNSIASAGKGLGAVTDTEAAIAVKACITPGCIVGVTMSGAGKGGGFSVGFPSDAIWKNISPHYTNNCPGMTYIPPRGGGPGPCARKGGVTSVPLKGGYSTECSPIVIDTKGNGLKHAFTDPLTNPIPFELKKGNLVHVSWPKPDSGVGFLVLDRNGDGVISSGEELFGNFTPQKNHPNPKPNGFLALAEYDLPEKDGNMDGVIDKQDKIYPKLRIWIDKYCYLKPSSPCHSLSNEVYTLDSQGVYSISLIYSLSSEQDEYGNQFLYKSVINSKVQKVDGLTIREHQKSNDKLGRHAVDVYLKTQE